MLGGGSGARTHQLIPPSVRLVSHLLVSGTLHTPCKPGMATKRAYGLVSHNSVLLVDRLE